ncbi:MAG: enoyl-CoA hydratase/isomerase family protein [Acidobacteriota bacterium]|nr:enoyl-CoA hydratase/isomerase family protein [Acidobacteriota bacterium]
MSVTIKVEYVENAVVIRFNRPEIKNPLSIETLDELAAIFTASESNPAIERIIFTGSGDTFASGANLNEIAQLNEETARSFGLRGQNLMQRIYHSRKLAVAAVDGFCMGGALDLAMSCKARIASPRSVFAHPGVGLGIITGWSGTQILPRLIGEARALEIFLTAKRIDANEALRIGLIDKISDDPIGDSLANFTANRSSYKL